MVMLMRRESLPDYRRWSRSLRAIALPAVLALPGAVGCGPEGTPPNGAVKVVEGEAHDSLVTVGEVVVSSHGLNDRYSFALATDGSYRFDRADAKTILAFDATLGQVTSIDLTGPGPIISTSVGRVSAGPDALDALRSVILGWGHRAALRSLSTLGLPTAEVAGRRGSVIQQEFIVHGPSNERLTDEPAPLHASAEIVVDQETGLVLRSVESVDGVSRSTVELLSLASVGSLPDDHFRPEVASLPPARELKSDLGFRRAALSDVASIVGYQPPVPKDVPAGYDLRDVYASQGPIRTAGGAVAVLVYARGLDTIVVTSRHAEQAADPYGGAAADLSEGYPEEKTVVSSRGDSWLSVTGVGV